MAKQRKTARAFFLDYDSGDYFVTICTWGHKHYFGEIYERKMELTQIGEYTSKQLSEAKLYNPEIDVTTFVVMPNHIHAIVHINNTMPDEIPSIQRTPNPFYRAQPDVKRHATILSRYIISLKGAVTKYARSKGIDFCWQPRYYDHLIRGQRDGDNITEYILNNIIRWEDDCFFK